MISIEFNGQTSTVDESMTISGLLAQSGVPVRYCAVELNQEIVPKSEYDSQPLRDGDRIEVVTLVGGG